jgi:hypothetical protein
MPPSGQVDVGSGDNATEDTGLGSQMLVRSSDVDGYANLCGNDPGGAATGISRVGTFTAPPHGCTAESASTVVASVTSGAGAAKL